MMHVNFAMTTLLNGIWEGTFLAVAMWLFLKLFPRLNPTTRFAVLWVTLLAVVALPLEPFAPERSFQARKRIRRDCGDKQAHDSRLLRPLRSRSRELSLQNPEASSRVASVVSGFRNQTRARVSGQAI